MPKVSMLKAKTPKVAISFLALITLLTTTTQAISGRGGAKGTGAGQGTIVGVGKGTVHGTGAVLYCQDGHVVMKQGTGTYTGSAVVIGKGQFAGKGKVAGQGRVYGHGQVSNDPGVIRNNAQVGGCQ